MLAVRKDRTTQPSRTQATTYLLSVVMPVVCWYTGIQPPSLLFIMDRDKLKIIVNDLEILLGALKAEVLSDEKSYRYDDIEPIEYDEEL